jgi:hypothetical protein
MSLRKVGLTLFFGLVCLLTSAVGGQEAERSALQALLPRIAGWAFSEPPRVYLPATLFEYIDGAAESYLSYAFEELIVANYRSRNSRATLNLEIYEMGSDRNAFGIYSSERFPESRFLSLGNEGYSEDGTLNFISGSKYVKLLCFDCGDAGETVLRRFAVEVEAGVKEKGQLPALLQVFPRAGLVAHSEKFILHNVLGFAFLHDGFIAGYKFQEQEFELFLIEAKDEREAGEMLKHYLELQEKNNQPPETIPTGVRFKDRYAHNVYLAQSGNLILGVMRIQDGFEETGMKYLQAFLDRVKR